MKLRRQQLDVSRNNCSSLTELVNLQFSCFVGNSDCLHSIDIKKTKSKLLAPNFSKGIQVANGVESSKKSIENVPSWTDEVKNVRNQIPS